MDYISWIILVCVAVSVGVSFVGAYRLPKDSKAERFVAKITDDDDAARPLVRFSTLAIYTFLILCLAVILPLVLPSAFERDTQTREAMTARDERVVALETETRKCRTGPENSDPTSFQTKIYAPFLEDGKRLTEDDVYSWRPEDIRTLAILSGEARRIVGEYTDGVAAVRQEYFGCLITMDADPRMYRFKVSIAPPETVGVKSEDVGRGAFRGSSMRDFVIKGSIKHILNGKTEVKNDWYWIEAWDPDKVMPSKEY